MVSEPSTRPRRPRPAPASPRAQWLATEILAMAEGYTPAELLARVADWDTEEWSQIDLDPAAVTPTAGQQAEVVAILAAR